MKRRDRSPASPLTSFCGQQGREEEWETQERWEDGSSFQDFGRIVESRPAPSSCNLDLSRDRLHTRSYQMDNVIDCLDLGFDERVCLLGCRTFVNYSGIETLPRYKLPIGLHYYERVAKMPPVEKIVAGASCLDVCITVNWAGLNELEPIDWRLS